MENNFLLQNVLTGSENVPKEVSAPFHGSKYPHQSATTTPLKPEKSNIFSAFIKILRMKTSEIFHYQSVAAKLDLLNLKKKCAVPICIKVMAVPRGRKKCQLAGH